MVASPQRFFSAIRCKNNGPSFTILPPTTSTPRTKSRITSYNVCYTKLLRSFYSFLNTRPMGQFVIRVCKTITCMMHGKNQIIQELEKSLKIKLGETTLDGKFTLMETNCLGQCHKGPAMLVNDVPYTELTPEKVRSIIRNNFV